MLRLLQPLPLCLKGGTPCAALLLLLTQLVRLEDSLYAALHPTGVDVR